MGTFSDSKTEAYIALAAEIAQHVNTCYETYYDDTRDVFRLKPRTLTVDGKYFWIPGKVAKETHEQFYSQRQL